MYVWGWFSGLESQVGKNLLNNFIWMELGQVPWGNDPEQLSYQLDLQALRQCLKVDTQNNGNMY